MGFGIKTIREELHPDRMCPIARLAVNNLNSGGTMIDTLLKTDESDKIRPR